MSDRSATPLQDVRDPGSPALPLPARDSTVDPLVPRPASTSGSSSNDQLVDLERNLAGAIVDGKPLDQLERSTLKALDDEENADALDGTAPSRYDRIDGGLYAWMAVAASFLVTFVVFGVQLSFGVFQRYYLAVDYPNASPSQVSLVGTIGPAVMFFMGLVVGRVAERTSYQLVVGTGAGFVGAGLILASFATQLWQLALTQGVLFGLGTSMAFFPGISVPAQWWVKRRALAVGISISGSGVGGIAYVQLLSALLPKIGSAWTLRVCGSLSLFLLGLAAAMIRTRVPSSRAPVDPNTGRPLPWYHGLVDFGFLRNPKFLAQLWCVALFPFAFNNPYFYLPSYVSSVLGESPSWAATLLTVSNVASIAGRILSGYFADAMGNVNMYLLTILISAASFFAFWLPAGDSAVLLYLFAIVYGFFSGGFFSLNTTVTAQLYGVAKLPSILGMLYSSMVIGNLAGTPIAGALVTAARNAFKETGSWPTSAHEYFGAILFSGLVILVGATSLLYLRYGLLDRRFTARI
ncbi:hypothetical protein AMAG_12628 [Allomyces macrogynus ATCC 38327]|uniref:Major facilitator superfamily (MFS) profile domain-containing protein n=1 Tax=Allomyces macrogynus (strain ATCC 38327) TaxID=578462 RepID=A0A0L0SZJ0_ALLM3|nr:hypothetical protein AMAG_12628 [Allomyces macrogynus ATCC 38327]|eukprot:KNE67911.1 hypothetical protein AMAG_12628 [Allomyces macrogynus ATCC 38327]